VEAARAKDLGSILLPAARMKALLAPGRYHALVIVADGPLLDIPAAALIDTTGQRLVQRYAISTPFSLSMLSWPTPNRLSPRNLLAVANPLGPVPTLPAAEKQARQLLQDFRPSVLLAGRSATKEAVLRDIGNYRILHFGVHGEANTQNGLYSRLFLAGQTPDEQELTAAEITEHPLAAQLTVLSACETIQGEKSGGEGLLGMAWAFRAAGCPSVVAAQWKVDEDATAALMGRFYKELRNPKTRKDEALRRAMLWLMGQDDYAAPKYWAAFQVMGKTDPIQLLPRSAAGSL
jgi:CHAT domain-containing protein